ncbi:Golgi resident protein GCP60 [Heptranchias perlo]|uniref:Golgi resident protein GCP60 n=1 Tax=Heptranchias perlo TaxID=212740 RepID=UPI00355A79CD
MLEMMAAADGSSGSGRLEVSIDGLTLSPDPEEGQQQQQNNNILLIKKQQQQQQASLNNAHQKPTPAAPESGPGSGDGRAAAAATAGGGGGAENQQHQEEEEEEVGQETQTRAEDMEKQWGFLLNELYCLALKFFKEKDGKAFHPTYEEKLKLVALHKQISVGPYSPDSCPEVGFFDVLGNDRRREWTTLGNMGKEDAMVEFVQLLNKCCNLFEPYVTSHKIEKEEQERKRREEEERRRREEEERERLRQEEERRQREEEEKRRREEEERRRLEEERFRMEQQKQQIMAALNTQTAVQFQQYAAQQYPGNFEQQQLLIRQLQEQHYQQYMQQLYQVQLAQQQATLQKQLQEPIVSTTHIGVGEVPTVNGQTATHTDCSEKEPEPESSEEVLENGPKDAAPAIAAPSMWTRPQIKDFKEKIRQDADSVITVGRGEVVTVRVPTHEEGSYLFWEFATDNYDIGFGVCFEWTDSPNTAVSVHVSESSDDEDEDEDSPSEGEKAKKGASKVQVDEVVPVYRRDCHEEVYAGSHQYPGRGVYLLKFDNSYSLWRSKTVYYRVYYTR